MTITGHLGPQSFQGSVSFAEVSQQQSERLKGLRNAMILYKSYFLMNNFKKFYSNKPKVWRNSLHVFATCRLGMSIYCDLSFIANPTLVETWNYFTPEGFCRFWNQLVLIWWDFSIFWGVVAIVFCSFALELQAPSLPLTLLPLVLVIYEKIRILSHAFKQFFFLWPIIRMGFSGLWGVSLGGVWVCVCTGAWGPQLILNSWKLEWKYSSSFVWFGVRSNYR